MSTPAIELSGVTKRYGTLTAVDDISLTVPSGQILAFLGPNGAGKSTTNEMILDLVQPDAGDIRVLGVTPGSAIRRGQLGAMLQQGTLLADTNVGTVLRTVHGLHAHPLPLGEVVERANLSGILRTGTNKLSGGEAQRVRFALAIMGDPELLILDEPTVGMDVSLRRQFWEQMKDLTTGGRTVMFATHYLDEADEFAERIVVINQGRIIADGSGAEIKSTVGGQHITFEGPERDYVGLDGVVSQAREGKRHLLICSDSDATLRQLVAIDGVHGLQVVAPRLEDAFVTLTKEAA